MNILPTILMASALVSPPFHWKTPAASQRRIPHWAPGSTARCRIRPRCLAGAGLHLQFEIPGRGLDRPLPQGLRQQSPGNFLRDPDDWRHGAHGKVVH